MPTFRHPAISTFKRVIGAAGLCLWMTLNGDAATAQEETCGSNRDAICVSGMVPKSDPARVWELLRGNLKFALYYFECLGGDQLSRTVVGGQLFDGRDLALDPDAAMALLGPSCDFGHEFACVAVASYFRETALGDVDPLLIAQLARRSCRADADACAFEASLYVDGDVFPVDHDKAAEILSFACARNAGYSCYRLGQLHLDGLAPGSSEQKGLDLVEQSCEFNFGEGCFDMGNRYPEQPSDPKEIKARRMFFEKSCTFGFGQGCYVAGALAGVMAPFWKQDFDEELAWHEKGCSLAYADSCTRAGSLHNGTQISDPDLPVSVAFSKRGCTLGDPIACANLGVNYEFGRGVAADGKKAFEAYKTACDAGNGGGCNGLGNIYAKGMAGEQDDFLAVEYFEKSCNLGDPIGCTNVAFFAENQRGAFRLDSQIEHFYQLGCDGGFHEACKRLKKDDAE
ncbi:MULTISPECIES: tetratricopeptide repeat protein [unclassified Roseovarius]|uniref:tetratricopeptide repeat protein n=1 Tax=unclassified Roseovarius TaxID=2614913 RepID=UPI00273D8CCE|nr:MULTISPECIES: tetratricopeptide repeat protein [unclassified Roseovarius]